jgi:hypothetical protein
LENLLNEVGTQKTMEEFTAQTKHSIKKRKKKSTIFPHVLKNSRESVPIIEKIVANIETLQKKLETIDEEMGTKQQFATATKTQSKPNSHSTIAV